MPDGFGVARVTVDCGQLVVRRHLQLRCGLLRKKP
jgi:hypothetical protein